MTKPTLVNLLIAAVLAATSFFLSGCTDSRPVLHVYNWSDYMDPDVIKAFEKKYGCRVVVDTFDSNEAMFSKIRAGGGTGYDLIFPTGYMAKIMNEQGMIEPLNHALIPNLKYVDKIYLAEKATDGAMRYSVPYMIGSTGIAYRTDRVKEAPTSWAVFGDATYAGRMTMLNDMREAIGAALISLGFSPNTIDDEELAKARDQLIAWKRNLAKFDAEQYKNGVASGEFFIVQGYSGDVLQVMEEVDTVDYVLPEEGFLIATDVMVIPMGAANPDLAYKFINFLHDPAVAAQNMEWVMFLCPNEGAYALVPEEIRNNEAIFIPAELLEHAHIIEDLGENNRKYSQVWDAVLSAR